MSRASLLFICLASTVASAQNAPANDEPNGKIIDPFARIPHPRDRMHLPDPRQAAEKAAAEGHGSPAPAVDPASAPPSASTTSAPPTTPGPASSPTSPSSPAQQITAEPATAPPMPSAPPPMPAFQKSKTPFGVTTMRIKTQHAVEDPPLAATHGGLTLEAGTGVGWIHLWDDNLSDTSPGGVAGLSLGIGGWITEDVALTARLAGSSVPSAKGVVVAAFLGPSLQIWVTDRTWLGAGIGLATYGRQSSSAANEVSYGGYGADLRVGRTFYANGKHALSGSLEITPSQVSKESDYGYDRDLNVTSIGVLFGYQYL